MADEELVALVLGVEEVGTAGGIGAARVGAAVPEVRWRGPALGADNQLLLAPETASSLARWAVSSVLNWSIRYWLSLSVASRASASCYRARDTLD